MSASQRHHFAARLLAAVGVTGAAACTTPETVEPEPTTAEERIARDLDRLEALQLVELGAVATTRPLDEQADRLNAFADVAEDTVGAVGPEGIADEFWDAEGNPSLCTRMDEGNFCLDRQIHADNLAALNALEIVEVVDILRTEPAMTGFCYSSWDTVHEDDCTRALELDALARATRD